MDLRPIELSDLFPLIDFMVQMRSESPVLAAVEVNKGRTADALRNMFQAGILMGVIAPERGCMIGLVSANWYDERPMAFEQMLYVAPEYRGRFLAPKLIRAFEREAFARGAVEVHVGSSTGIQDDRTAQMYSVMGYTRAGISLRKELHV